MNSNIHSRGGKQEGRGERQVFQLFPFFLSFLLALPLLVLPCPSVSKYLLRVYHVPGSVQGTWDIV